MSLCICERFWSKWPWLKASSPELHNTEQQSWFTREVESWNCYFCPWVSSATDISITLINSNVLASPMVLTMWHLHIKIVWPNKMLLTQRFCKTWLRLLIIGTAKRNRYVPEKSVNKYDSTISCFWLANHNDWSRWFAISSLPSFCSLSFRFTSEVGKTKDGS
jgi:hypothetical protein